MYSIERIRKEVKDIFDGFVPEQDFGPNKTFAEMGLDGVDAMEAVLYLENEFDIYIDDDKYHVIFDMDNLTPQRLIDIVVELTSNFN